MAGTPVWVSLLPPSECPPINPNGNYSEPYRLDYITWAKEIAKLSLRYSNLKGYQVQELQENLNLSYLQQSYIDSIEAAGKSINPKLQLIKINANTYWVATSGNDKNSGTYAMPFATINHAYSLAVAGDSIIVKAGVYTWKTFSEGYLYCNKSGTAKYPIVLKSETRFGAVIDGQYIADKNHDFAFYITGDYNVIDGFKIRRTAFNAITIYSAYNKIINCEIDSNGFASYYPDWGHDGVYEGPSGNHNSYLRNYIHDNGRTYASTWLDHGLYIAGNNSLIAYNLLIHNCGDGITHSGDSTDIYNNVIAYNGIRGISLSDAIKNLNIRNNIFYKNNNGYGIHAWFNAADSAKNIYVSNNIFYEIDASHKWDFIGETFTPAFIIGINYNENPQFANDKTSFALLLTSPAIDKGFNWEQIKDFNLNSKYGNEWDIGAMEYKPVSGSVPAK